MSGISHRRSNAATSARVLKLVNGERAKRGLAPVRSDDGLRLMAEDHAIDLAATVDPTRGKPSRQTAHRGFDRRAREATRKGYLVLAEVVMIGYAGDLNAVARRTVRGWLGSWSHRTAILDGDRRIMGISTRIMADGRYFVVGLLSNGRSR